MSCCLSSFRAMPIATADQTKKAICGRAVMPVGMSDIRPRTQATEEGARAQFRVRLLTSLKRSNTTYRVNKVVLNRGEAKTMKKR
jgi:hypothetical protein